MAKKKEENAAAVETEEMNKQNLDWEAELDWIFEQEQIARVKRETEHKIAVREAAIQSVLAMTLVVNVVEACF